jgi:hypothetical protein
MVNSWFLMLFLLWYVCATDGGGAILIFWAVFGYFWDVYGLLVGAIVSAELPYFSCFILLALTLVT